MSENISLEINPDEIREMKTDSRGRVNFGKSHAHETVLVAVEYRNED